MSAAAPPSPSSSSAPSVRAGESRPEVGQLLWNWRKAPTAPVDPIPSARRHALRQGLIGLLIAIVLKLLGHPGLASVAAAFASLTLVLGGIAPLVHQRVSTGFVRLVTRGVTIAVLSVVYFAVFWPLGLFVRRSATARFKKAWESKADSYWTPRTKESSPERTF